MDYTSIRKDANGAAMRKTGIFSIRRSVRSQATPCDVIVQYWRRGGASSSGLLTISPFATPELFHKIEPPLPTGRLAQT